MDIVNDVEIPEDKEYNHEAVFFIKNQSKTFDVTKCPPYIKATHKQSKDVSYYDLTYYVMKDVAESELKYITNTTNEMTLVMKKYLWYQKLKLEKDNDGIHTNKYLYRNTGFTYKTPASIISSFYNAQMHMLHTYKEKKNMWILSQVALNPTF